MNAKRKKSARTSPKTDDAPEITERIGRPLGPGGRRAIVAFGAAWRWCITAELGIGCQFAVVLQGR